MRIYELKIVILTKFYRKCPFSGQLLNINGFRAKQFDIDHIYSIPRRGKTGLALREKHLDAFESLLNLRPLKHSNHIDMNCEFEYKSSLKWEKYEFLKISEGLLDERFNDLKLMNMVDDMDYLDSLTTEFFEYIDIDRPDWLKRF